MRSFARVQELYHLSSSSGSVLDSSLALLSSMAVLSTGVCQMVMTFLPLFDLLVMLLALAWGLVSSAMVGLGVVSDS